MAARCSRLMLAGVAVLALVLLVNAGSSAATYNFNDAAAEAALDGVHGGLDFDIGMWRGSSGIGGLDQCARFSAIGCTFRAFHLPPLAILTSIRISSGWAAGTYAIRDGVNPEVKGELESNAPVTVTTDWAKPSVTITVELSMGADAGIDDVIYALSGTPPDLTTVTFQQDTDGYTGTVDTYVSRDNPTTSYGASTRAYVKGDSAGQVQEALIRFDGIFGASFDQIPPGAIISSATLTVTSGKANGGIASCFRMLTGWDATSTWNSLDNGIELADVEYLTPLEGWNGSGIGSGVPISYRVTGSVQAWANDPASNFGWVFRCPPDNNSWNFYSSQWTTNPAARPKLEVTYATQPLVLPVFNVTDQTSGSSVFTDSATVNVSLLAYVEQEGAITGYAITEENVSPDPFEDTEWSPLPSTYAIQATPPAAVTLYAWVRDDYWNVAGAVDSIYYSPASPSVAGLVVAPGYDGATITFDTDADAVCWIEYGPPAGPMDGATELDLPGREHSFTIKGLLPATAYAFRIHADAAVSPMESFATTDAGLFYVGFQTDEPPVASFGYPSIASYNIAGGMVKPTAVREPSISPGYETAGNTTRPPGNGFDTCYLAMESRAALYGGDTEGYARIEPPAGVTEPLPGTDASPPGSAWSFSFLMATRAPLNLVTTGDWGEAQPGIRLLSNRGDDGAQDVLLGVRLSNGGIVADHAGGVHVLVPQYAQNGAYRIECRLDMISDTFQTYVDGMPVGPVLSQITPSASKGIGGFYARGGQAPTQYANTIGSRDFLLIDSISLRAVAVQSPVKLTTFSVTDLTSGSTLLTNDAIVSVSITAEPAEGATIDGYAVTEAPGPPADSWLPDISTYAIQASPGASITLYAWAKDSAGNVASKSAIILYSIAQPVVSNVVITDNANGTAIATWTTDIPAEGSVEYGPVSSSGVTPNTAAENALLSDHSVTLTGIAAGINYKIVLVNSEKAEPPIYWPDKWPIPGDANMDCRVNILDLIAIRGKLNQSVDTDDNWIADVNEDGRINILDLILVRGKLNTKCP